MNPSEFDTISTEFLETIVGKKWSTYPGCIGAWVAEMDFGTAPVIKDELRKVVDDGFFGYMPDAARDRMQKAVSDWYGTHGGWKIPVDWVRPVPDVIEAMRAAINDFSAPGSKIIVPTPAYMPFLLIPKLLGREHVEVPCLLRNDRWELDYDGIDAAFADGGGLFINCNPHNPLGRVYERQELLKLAEIVEKHGGRVFSDEIHAPITYPGQTHVPYASISDAAANHTVTASSASKAWNMPGLKCAQLILSNEVDAENWKKVGFLVEHGASTFGVIANGAAFDSGQPWLDDVMTYLDGNRRLLGTMLTTLLPEVRYVMPEGSYLTWLDFRETGIGDEVDTFFRDNAKVAIVNGRACGAVGTGHVRLNIAMSRPLLEETVTKMASAVKAANVATLVTA